MNTRAEPPMGTGQPLSYARTNSMAIWSAIVGIASWFVCPFLGGLIAILLGHAARSEIRRTGDLGGGWAMVGLVLGYLHLLVYGMLALLFLLFGAGVLAAVFGAAATTSHPASSQPSGSAAIGAITVSVDKPTGHCPIANYLFTGQVTTNGLPRQITYQWIKPDGTSTDPASASIAAGSFQTVAQLQFAFQGNGSAEGDAIMKVLSPTSISSAPVHVTYACP